MVIERFINIWSELYEIGCYGLIQIIKKTKNDQNKNFKWDIICAWNFNIFLYSHNELIHVENYKVRVNDTF